MVRARAPRFENWWHERAIWDGDPMRELRDWLQEGAESDLVGQSGTEASAPGDRRGAAPRAICSSFVLFGEAAHRGPAMTTMDTRSATRACLPGRLGAS